MDDPDRESEVLAVAGTLEHTVADPQMLRADPLEPEVGVGGAELPGPGERDVAELSVGEVAEGRVEGRRGHAGEPIRGIGVIAMSFPARHRIGPGRAGTGPAWLVLTRSLS